MIQQVIAISNALPGYYYPKETFVHSFELLYLDDTAILLSKCKLQGHKYYKEHKYEDKQARVAFSIQCFNFFGHNF